MWPCRGVAEHAYCPRLFYYMSVEGVFAPSADTEQGAGVHRRVDRPSAGIPSAGIPSAAVNESRGPLTRDPEDAANTPDPERPRIIRSLALTSERLGITGTLDLAEIDGQTAIPVEYRKGRPRRSPAPTELVDEMLAEPITEAGPEPWPTDRVQLGLQVLLLEEAGFTVAEAFLYYASERLRLRVTVDEGLRQDALRELERAKATAAGARPAPLVNDPRCPRCSLQSICLPDEINHQRLSPCRSADGSALRSEAELRPRKLWPARDDGIHVVTQREGVRIGVRGEFLRLSDADGATVRDFPLATIESLCLIGGVQISSQALGVCASHDVPVAFATGAGRLTAMMDPLGPTSAAVRAAQVRVLDRPEKSLELARALTVAKITNQRTLLMRNHSALPSGVAGDLLDCLHAAEAAISIDILRGHEGNAAAIYFRHFAGMFKPAANGVAMKFDNNGRQRRPPPDPINAVLSFGYAMLTHECTTACRLASLEPTLGALHATRPGRPALSLDLMEPFRPLIADSVAISAFNRGELTEGHFLSTASGCALTDAGRKGFFSAHGRRLDTEVSHPIFGYRLSYRRMVMLHARLIAAWLLDEVPTLAFLTTR